MKRVLVFLFGLSLILILISSKDKKIIIPKESIRYRIIANSNSFKDQEQKYLINTEIEPVLNDIINSSNSLNESRYNINHEIPKIKNILNKYDATYDINYGLNYFPEKTYKGVSYDAGNYESLVITLGDGLGENWWCVLFPPLCLIEASSDELDDVTYSFYISEIVQKFQ